jgi:nitrite reductase (NADH) small subunit
VTGPAFRPLGQDHIVVFVDGQEVVLEAAGPHRKGQLRHGYLNRRTGRLACPLHHSTFDVPSGRRVSGPACRDLRVQSPLPSARSEPSTDREETE